MKIQKAKKKDLKEIGKLMKKELSKPPFNERAPIDLVLKSLNFYFKLGEMYFVKIDKKIAGVIIFIIEQWWEGPIIIIEDLVIKKGFQVKGLGKELMKFVEKYGKKKKIKYVFFATHKKSAAVKFYKKLGYEPTKNTLFMRKKIK